jgi:hypothetical protein
MNRRNAIIGVSLLSAAVYTAAYETSSGVSEFTHSNIGFVAAGYNAIGLEGADFGSAEPVNTAAQVAEAGVAVPTSEASAEQSSEASTAPEPREPSSPAASAAACPDGWFTLVPGEYGSLKDRDFGKDLENAEAFPDAICIKEPTPKDTEEWFIDGETVNAQVYVLNPDSSPCGDDLAKCLDKAPDNADPIADEASAGPNDGSEPDRQNASGKDLSEMSTQLHLRRADGSVEKLVFVS